jgi:hypothetical protein
MQNLLNPEYLAFLGRIVYTNNRLLRCQFGTSLARQLI